MEYHEKPTNIFPRNILLDDTKFERLPDLARYYDSRREEIDSACIDFTLVVASWVKDYVFDQCRGLVQAINQASNIDDIGRQYKTVTREAFPDPLHNSRYKLLLDPSADEAGKWVNMKKGPIKTKDSCLRKAESFSQSSQFKQKWFRAASGGVTPPRLRSADDLRCRPNDRCSGRSCPLCRARLHSRSYQ